MTNIVLFCFIVTKCNALSIRLLSLLSRLFGNVFRQSLRSKMKTSYYLLHCVWLSSLFMSYPGAMGSGICGCVCSNSNEIPNTGGQAGQYPLTGYKCPKGTYKVTFYRCSRFPTYWAFTWSYMESYRIAIS